jgi:hypothetical protein
MRTRTIVGIVIAAIIVIIIGAGAAWFLSNMAKTNVI